MQAVTVGLERLRALTEVTTLAGDHMGFFFSLHQFSDFALLALRIALGAVFLTHGLGKRKLWSTQPSAQMPAGMLRNLRILSIAEPAGALGMLVGFLTQLAALGLVIAMLGALQFLITKVHRKFTGETAGWEFEFMLLITALALVILGGGKYALDRVIFRI